MAHIPRRRDRKLPPREASKVVYTLLPRNTRRTDYADFVHEYRRKIGAKSCARADRFAYWRAADDSWRAVPDYVKHGLIQLLLRIILRG